MKKNNLSRVIIGLTVVVYIYISLSSCKRDFFEKPESNDVTLDTIFSTKIKALTFLSETYRLSMPDGFPDDDWMSQAGMNGNILAAATDEADSYDSYGGSFHNTGNWNASGTESMPGNREDLFNLHYKAIRYTNILIENIQRINDLGDDEKNQWIAEAKFLRAMQYAELVKRYGGVPIVDKVIDVSDEAALPRNTYAEVIDFIIGDCDAGMILPVTYPSSMRGRATKGAALALKSRVMLYAASPLHNSQNIDPYFTDKRELTGYQTFDVNRWNNAAKAAKEVLDWAEEAGVSLINTGDPEADQQTIAETSDNREIIIANKWSHGAGRRGNWFQPFMLPRSWGWFGYGVTYNFMQQYHTNSGDDIDWPMTGTFDDYKARMDIMEPRFKYAVITSDSYWREGGDFYQYGYKKDGSVRSRFEPFNGVGYMRKFLKGYYSGIEVQWTVFRLAEFYLNYAEALNEYSANVPEAYTALNVIRKRAGLPEIQVADPKYATQATLRQLIQRERTIELAFEDHRFFDVRRWLIAHNEGVMRGDMWHIKLFEQNDNSLIYKKTVFEKRVFEPKMYLYPIPQLEIDKGYLVQNPGW